MGVLAHSELEREVSEEKLSFIEPDGSPTPLGRVSVDLSLGELLRMKKGMRLPRSRHGFKGYRLDDAGLLSHRRDRISAMDFANDFLTPVSSTVDQYLLRPGQRLFTFANQEISRDYGRFLDITQRSRAARMGLRVEEQRFTYDSFANPEGSREDMHPLVCVRSLTNYVFRAGDSVSQASVTRGEFDVLSREEFQKLVADGIVSAKVPASKRMRRGMHLSTERLRAVPAQDLQFSLGMVLRRGPMILLYDGRSPIDPYDPKSIEAAFRPPIRINGSAREIEPGGFLLSNNFEVIEQRLERGQPRFIFYVTEHARDRIYEHVCPSGCASLRFQSKTHANSPWVLHLQRTTFEEAFPRGGVVYANEPFTEMFALPLEGTIPKHMLHSHYSGQREPELPAALRFAA